MVVSTSLQLAEKSLVARIPQDGRPDPLLMRLKPYTNGSEPPQRIVPVNL